MSKKINKKDRIALNSIGVLKNSDLNPSKFNVDPEIQPITDNQKKAVREWNKGKNLVMHGTAGTGKTFLAVYLAVKEMMDNLEEGLSIKIIRSTVQTRDMGFLTGGPDAKVKEFANLYHDLLHDVTGIPEAFAVLQKTKRIEFMSTAFLRGQTWDDSLVVVDEAQNMTDAELSTIMTRVGENTRIALCGDNTRQNDLGAQRKVEESGFPLHIQLAHQMNEMSVVEFGVDDIVRSGFVKSYIIARERLCL